jgi:dsDNA-specific endonuclease/ATPase MutS2
MTYPQGGDVFIEPTQVVELNNELRLLMFERTEGN